MNLALALSLACGPPVPPGPPDDSDAGAATPVVRLPSPPRNVLVVSVDTLRRDAVGRYAEGPSLTPFLDGLLAQGVALDDVTACSNWTFASAACVLSGRSNLDAAPDRGMVPIQASGVVQGLPGGADTPGDTLLLAGRLADAGFATVLVSANVLIGGDTGTGQGYASVDVAHRLDATAVFQTARERLQAALDAGADRWLLHLHTFEPHGPYRPPPEYLPEPGVLPPIPYDLDTDEGWSAALQAWTAGWLSADASASLREHLVARYAGEVRWWDDQLAGIWSGLEAEGWLDDTLVLLWSDHGESILEHGVQGHGRWLHGNENRAIAAFLAPGLEPVAFADPVAAVDLLPTLLHALELPVPLGLSGVPVGTAPADRPRTAFTVAFEGPAHQVTLGTDKLHVSWTGALARYDLADDPDETTDLHVPGDFGGITGDLWAVLRADIERALPWVQADPRHPALVWPEGAP